MSAKSGLSTESYKGVRDFYPVDWAVLSAMFAKTREVLGKWGYQEYQASPLEHSELYESKGNEEIIKEQTFSFVDRGERRITLRPEMTPTLARMVAGKRRELTFPLRWYSIGNRFRYERPQRGRLREFYQTDVDFIGLAEGESDIEVLMIASDILKSFGAADSDFRIRVNSRALLGAACAAVGLSDAEGVKKYWQLLDRKSKMSGEEFAAARGDKDPLAAVEEATDPAVATEKEKILKLIQTLKDRGVTNIAFDPEIIRGFDYYTGMVFEISDTNPENPRSLFGGGRYDGLVSLFGGDSIPAVGFALSDVSLANFLETHGYTPVALDTPELYIGTPSSSDIVPAQELAKELREKGARIFINLTEKSLGDQVKDADRRSIPYFVAYGASEASSGVFKVKELAKGIETEVSRAQLAAHVHKN